ncbi:MAG: hypothetical protein ACK4Z5_11150 [Brevundimonas sp.]
MTDQPIDTPDEFEDLPDDEPGDDEDLPVGDPDEADDGPQIAADDAGASAMTEEPQPDLDDEEDGEEAD